MAGKSRGGDLGELTQRKAYQLGEAIAEHDAILITGGCPGLPYDAVRGAKVKNGLVVGISPGLSIDEHIGKYSSPVDGFDLLIYTGSGLMGREITNIRSCDIVIIVGGRTGTLGEFSIAYDEGRLIGVLSAPEVSQKSWKPSLRHREKILALVFSMTTIPSSL